MNPLQSVLCRLAVALFTALTVSVPLAQTQSPLEEASAALEQFEQLHQARRFQEALALAQRAVQLRETALGPDHIDTGAALHQLARASYQLKDLVAAEAAYKRALSIRRTQLGAEHPETRKTMAGLADVFTDSVRFDEAESLLQQVIVLDRKVSDRGRDAASHLRALARLYLYKADYARAAEYFEQTLQIRQRVLGPEHRDTANSLADLGIVNGELGRYEQALQYLRRALEIRQKVLGPDHPASVETMQRLAASYLDGGDYTTAENLMLQALQISERNLGAEHLETIAARTGLGGMYVATGAYARAESILQPSLALAEANLGSEHPATAFALEALSVLYSKLRNRAKAEPLLQRTLALNERLYGPESVVVARTAGNLGAMYFFDNEADKALPLYRRSLAVLEARMGAEHPDTALGLNNLGELYSLTGSDYPQGESLLLRSLAIREKVLGTTHPLSIGTLNSLGVVNWKQGRLAAAQQYFNSAQLNSAILSVRLLRWGSDSRKQAFLETLREDLNTRVSFSLAASGSDATALGLLDVLLYKGRVLDSAAQALANLRQSLDARDGKLLEELQQVSTDLSLLTYRGPENLKPADYRRRVTELVRRQQQLEAQIAGRSERVRQQLTAVTLPGVMRAIPADAALVEFLRYKPFEPRAKTVTTQRGAPRYVAYVLKQKGAPVALDLGEAAPIDALVRQLRRSLGNAASTDIQERAAQLSAKLIAPLLPQLSERRRLLVSPDGSLNLIPFAALVDERGQYLVERFDISYLTSGRDLLRFTSRPRARSTARVLANPDYGLVQASATAVSSSTQRSLDFDRGGLTFRTLPGTALEASALKSLLGLTDREVLLGAQATEFELKRMRAPRLLHLATHGFFLDDRQLDSQLQAAGAVTDVPASLSENPLLRAGLALAGANTRRSSAGDDGILTALEAAQLDLIGTELVVLSACETGIGEVPDSEGVYGLRRAMVLAGAQTQMTSLWKVADAATSELMVAYYKRLLQSQERSAALRSTQRAMMAQPQFSHPYYWASFVQIGNWRALPEPATAKPEKPRGSAGPKKLSTGKDRTQ